MGLLVAKTLSNATANPFLAGGTGSYNPVVALDVFLVQVCQTNTCVWLLTKRAAQHCHDVICRGVKSAGIA